MTYSKDKNRTFHAILFYFFMLNIFMGMKLISNAEHYQNIAFGEYRLVHYHIPQQLQYVENDWKGDRRRLYFSINGKQIYELQCVKLSQDICNEFDHPQYKIQNVSFYERYFAQTPQHTREYELKQFQYLDEHNQLVQVDLPIKPYENSRHLLQAKYDLVWTAVFYSAGIILLAGFVFFIKFDKTQVENAQKRQRIQLAATFQWQRKAMLFIMSIAMLMVWTYVISVLYGFSPV